MAVFLHPADDEECESSVANILTSAHELRKGTTASANIYTAARSIIASHMLKTPAALLFEGITETAHYFSIILQLASRQPSQHHVQSYASGLAWTSSQISKHDSGSASPAANQCWVRVLKMSIPYLIP
eukprot:scaffold277090_cov20-Prasinocladus_malaysianus.AAC.1